MHAFVTNPGSVAFTTLGGAGLRAQAARAVCDDGGRE
jgi:hypothetical protein